MTGLTADYHFEVFYGVSGNSHGWWDNRRAESLGYRQADSADPWIAALEAKTLGDPLADAHQGGVYVRDEYTP